MRTLCFGEAIVDLIRPREAEEFVPALGGVSANVAVTAARHGAGVAFAGAAGDDPWGAWLRARLAAEGLDLRWFALVAGLRTAVAFATLDDRGDAGYDVYGDGPAAVVRALRGHLEGAVQACDALFFTSNTLAGAGEAELTRAARARALALGQPVVFDVSLRLHRWGHDEARACAAARACVPGAFLVKCNAAEAAALTGAGEPSAAAGALLELGAHHAVVTLGAEGAILRGRDGTRRVAAAPPVRVLSTVGAGDVFAGVLLARLALGGYDGRVLADALPAAAEHAARACEHWGALA